MSTVVKSFRGPDYPYKINYYDPVAKIWKSRACASEDDALKWIKDNCKEGKEPDDWGPGIGIEDMDPLAPKP